MEEVAGAISISLCIGLGFENPTTAFSLPLALLALLFESLCPNKHARQCLLSHFSFLQHNFSLLKNNFSLFQIIEQNIKQIARADSLINSDIFQSASALSGFINSIQIDEEETYLDKFRHGMKTLPLELQHFSNGKDIDIAKYITD